MYVQNVLAKRLEKKKENVDNDMKRLHPHTHTQQHYSEEKAVREWNCWGKTGNCPSLSLPLVHTEWDTTLSGAVRIQFSEVKGTTSAKREMKEGGVGKPALDSKHTAQCREFRHSKTTLATSATERRKEGN